MKLLYITAVLLFTLSLSCKEKKHDEPVDGIRTIVRFGGQYYSIYAFDSGALFVTKGKCSNSIEPFKALTVQKSKTVKSDLVKAFYKRVGPLRQKPIIIPSNIADSPRIEIYFEGTKVYDAYFSDGPFWDFFSSIEPILPLGYNPFLTSEHPFDQ